MNATSYHPMGASRLLAAITGSGTDWMEDAVCAQFSPLVIDPAFHPEGPDADRWAEMAWQVCIKCPVRAQCLAWALGDTPGSRGEPRGVWGGLTAEERRQILRARHRYGRKDRIDVA